MNTYGCFMHTESLNEIVARNVAAAMKAAGENASTVARATGIHRTTLSNKLGGKRAWSTPELELLADHFDTEPANLLVAA